MAELSQEEIEQRKKDIFDSMGKRSQGRILKKGYEDWNPFEEPKDPIDIRKDPTKRTTQQLIREFLQQTPAEGYSNSYASGAFDICLGLINDNDKFIGMYDFSVWYKNLLEEDAKKQTKTDKI
ncbi:MAG: hypothetical protein GY793_03720 [Proteobacteria bacterium]|nr:hypothetical protein [Pseudomonadota bacterium]